MNKKKFADIEVAKPLKGPFTYSIPQDFYLEVGMRVKVPFGRQNLTGFVVKIHENEPQNFKVKDILEVYDQKPLFDQRLIEFSQQIAYQYLAETGEVLSMALPSAFSERYRGQDDWQKDENYILNLSVEQQNVYEKILKEREQNHFYHLLHGITGSGKTEVYIKLAKRVISEGQSVILLVPEISLSSQIFKRLKSAFGEELVLYHSQLTANKKLANWQRFYTGDAKIVVGTRSAVFMQTPNLGLIIIDEEHDGSYKENKNPRYNARRLAVMRSKKEEALLILGSATPSIESYYAAQRGVFCLHELKMRYGKAELPQIEILPVKPKDGSDILSGKLNVYTRQALERKEQVIYLLNRRGFSPMIICDECGEVLECPNCNIGLTAHHGNIMVCHYCNYQTAIPQKCPKCQGKLVILGAGTQRLEDIVAKNFVHAKIFRLDQDSAKKKNTASELIDKMKNQEIDILLGTQMIAKGFDFSRVTLVGVMMADIGLNLPDFRATERIFSLLMQVAGRSGRGELPGKVCIQTLNPEHYIFEYLCRHDYYGFYQNELEVRKMLNYPPFSRIARLLFRGPQEEKVKAAANQVAAYFQKNLKIPEISLLGPSPAPLSKVAKNYRYHLIFKSTTISILLKTVRKIKEQNKKDPYVYMEIDIDPFEML